MTPTSRLVTSIASIASIAPIASALVALLASGCGPHDASGPTSGNWQSDGPARPLSSEPESGSQQDGDSGLRRPEGCADARRGWSAMQPAPLPPGHVLEHATLLWTGTTTVLVGRAVATTPGASRRDVYATYDLASDTWTPLPAPPWGGAPRGPQAVVGNGRVVVWGGERGEGDGAIYDLATSTWSAIPAAPVVGSSGARLDAQLVWSTTTGELIVWGGVSEGGAPRVDGAAYQPTRGTWRRIADAPLRPRVTKAVWSGAAMTILGGRDPSCAACAPFDDGATYDPVRDAWSAIGRPAAFAPRMVEVALPVTTPERSPAALFFGGVAPSAGASHADGSGTREDGLLLDLVTDRTEYVPAPQAGVLRPAFTRTGYVAWVGGDRFWFWGGSGAHERRGAEEPFGDGASFDLVTRTWAPIPDGGPSPRADAAAAWTGCEAIVLGGRRGDARLHDGAVLRP